MDNSTRQAKRAPVTLKIKFKSETLAQFIERYAVDVSPGGIFIRTKEPLAVGTPMKFEFQLRDATPLITGEGTVVWTRENDPARPNAAPGMGVRFDRLGEGSQPILDKILAEKNKQGGAATPEPQQRMFTDAPTRVAPSPLVGQLLGESRGKLGEMAPPRAGFGDERTDTTPLPRPMPFHSDAEEFPDETFEEATKVRTVEDLIAATAHGGTMPKSPPPPPRATIVTSTPPPPSSARTPGAPPIAPPPETPGVARTAMPVMARTATPMTSAAPPPPPGSAAQASVARTTTPLPPPPPIAHTPSVARTATPVTSLDDLDGLIEESADAEPSAFAPPAAKADEAKADEAKVDEAKVEPAAKADEAQVEPAAAAAPTEAEAAAPRKTPPVMAAVEPPTEAEAAPAPKKTPPMMAAVEPGAEASPESAEAKPDQAKADADAEALPATEPAAADAATTAPAEAAADAAAAPIVAETTAPREPTPMPRPAPEPKAAAPAPAPQPAVTTSPSGEQRKRPTGVPVPPRELTDPNRVHQSTTAAAQLEPPPGMGSTGIIFAVVFAAALGGLIWFFFLRSSSDEETRVDDPDPEVTTATTPGAGTTTPPGPGPAAGSDVSSPVGANTVATEVRSTVPDAMVTFPVEGWTGPLPFTANLEKGKQYTARVTAAGYREMTITLTGGQKPAPVKLEQMARVIRIESTPPGALVSIDGVSTGQKTPADVTLNRAQAAKASVEITVAKSGFAPYAADVADSDYLLDGESMVMAVDAVLEKQGGGASRGSGAGGGARGGAQAPAAAATPAPAAPAPDALK